MTMPTSFEDSIHTSVAQAVAAIPEGKSNALIIDGTYDQTDGPNFQIVYLKKVNDNFEIATSGSYSGSKGIAGQVQGVISW